MTIREMQDRALAISERYAELNRLNGHKKWRLEDYVAGFVGDVGDFSKLVMAKGGLRSAENIDKKIVHELNDCIWSILVIAHELNIDIPETFEKNMQELEERINKKINEVQS